MTKLEKLIEELCPNGVTFRTLNEIGTIFKGMSGVTNKWAENGNCRFVDYKNVYNNIKIDVLDLPFATVKKIENQIVLNQGDILFTSASETPDECAISSVIEKDIVDGILLDDHLFGIRLNKTVGNPIFFNYYFRSDSFRKTVNKTVRGVTRFYISMPEFAKIKIPLPPLEVQAEIVRILDDYSTSVTALQQELEKELTARKKQYEYYTNSLYNFDENIKIISLAELADISTGSSNTNEAVENGEFPFYVRSQDELRKDTYEYDETAIITAGDGVGVGKVFHYVEGKYALHQRAYRIHIKSDVLIPKFFFYYMKSTFYDYISKTGFHSSVSSIRRPMLNNFMVPVPPLSEQERIVKILDRFDKLCNDISEGIPAEIEARQKQYEYYRDKLLTFKELTV